MLFEYFHAIFETETIYHAGFFQSIGRFIRFFQLYKQSAKTLAFSFYSNPKVITRFLQLASITQFYLFKVHGAAVEGTAGDGCCPNGVAPTELPQRSCRSGVAVTDVISCEAR
jgi:hypothetical protein